MGATATVSAKFLFISIFKSDIFVSDLFFCFYQNFIKKISGVTDTCKEEANKATELTQINLFGAFSHLTPAKNNIGIFNGSPIKKRVNEDFAQLNFDFNFQNKGVKDEKATQNRYNNITPIIVKDIMAEPNHFNTIDTNSAPKTQSVNDLKSKQLPSNELMPSDTPNISNRQKIYIQSHTTNPKTSNYYFAGKIGSPEKISPTKQISFNDLSNTYRLPKPTHKLNDLSNIAEQQS